MLVFMMPIIIKTTHFLYVHHEHHHSHSTHKPAICKTHEKCSICTFDYIEFINNIPPKYASKSEIILDYYIEYPHHTKKVVVQYSFQLRAPPIG